MNMQPDRETTSEPETYRQIDRETDSLLSFYLDKEKQSDWPVSKQAGIQTSK